MIVPVSVRTHRATLRDLAATPQLGGWALIFLALGPPTLVGIVVALIDAVRLALTGVSFGAVTREPPFLGPTYFTVVLGTAVLFNLLLALRFDVAIRILYMPAWAFAALAIVLQFTVGSPHS